jgi:hypothetical protein
MLLVLKSSEAQSSELDKLLAAQQTPGDSHFHHWLTPAAFADRFSPSAAQTGQVAAWLRAQGMKVAPTPAGRGWIEFSGTVARVQRAFGTTVVSTVPAQDGKIRYQLIGKVRLPESVASVAVGLASLDGVLSEPASTNPVSLSSSLKSLAAQTSLANAEALTPGLADGVLQLSAVRAEGTTGTGETIAIPSRSDLRPGDFTAFRQTFGLPSSELAVQFSGPNPGRAEDEAEVLQAASWAGVAAPGARILVLAAASTNATDGIDLALAKIVDGNLAHTVSVSYTSCEAHLSPAHQSLYAALYRQAAAQGIAVIAAAGDSGAAACHSSADAAPVQTGYGVNALAATPWNLAVGTVAIGGEAGLTPWRPAGSSYASGGGTSRVYATPAWQSAEGLPESDFTVPTGHPRYLPDVALPVALGDAQSLGLAFCFAGDSPTSDVASACRPVAGGGSAASAAIFAGLAALLAEKYGPQGNLAPNLYRLARQSSAEPTSNAIVDVNAGSGKLACLLDTPDCEPSVNGSGLGEIGYTAQPGFDRVTGLGSIRADKLVARWASPDVTGTAPVTVEMTTQANQTYNPSATIVLSAKVLSGSGSVVPTGTVQFYDDTTSANAGTPVSLAADGTASYSETGQFTSGGHNIKAQYSGDSVYEAATSLPVTINIQPSTTTTTVASSTSSPSGGSAITVTGTVKTNNPGTLPPTGTVAVTLDGILQGTGTLATTSGVTSASVSVTIPSAGSHNIQGAYSGDVNYTSSTSSTITVTVVKAASVTSLSATPATLETGVLETLTATVAPQSAVTGTTYTLTGTVAFYDGGTTLLGTVNVTSNTAILTGISLSNTASHTLTAVYSGDANFSTSVSSPVLLTSNLLPVTVTLVGSSSIVAPDQPVTLTATVTPVNTPPTTAEQHPSGYVLFYAGTTLISGQIPVVESTGYSSVASTVVPHITPGQYAITAQYFGDPTYGPATSNSLNLAAEDFTISSTITNINMVQGTTATVPFTVASLGGLTGPIQVVCAEQNPPTFGAIVCTFSPSVIDGSGTAALTVVTTSGPINVGQTPSRPGNPLAPTGGIALACAGVLILPIGRRGRWVRGNSTASRMLLGALLLVGLAGAGLGCTNSVSLTNNSQHGTPLGVHTLKITAGALVNTVTVTHSTYLTVNVTP